MFSKSLDFKRWFQIQGLGLAVVWVAGALVFACLYSVGIQLQNVRVAILLASLGMLVNLGFVVAGFFHRLCESYEAKRGVYVWLILASILGSSIAFSYGL